ncbi:MAG: hypothetical protein K2O70_08040 [Desulfovibrionaceae bacterium]|nr:hypothetical protein [Desulfovibrionaceae bacterium]
MVTSIEVSFALLQNPVKILHFFSMNMFVKCGGNGWYVQDFAQFRRAFCADVMLFLVSAPDALLQIRQLLEYGPNTRFGAGREHGFHNCSYHFLRNVLGYLALSGDSRLAAWQESVLEQSSWDAEHHRRLKTRELVAALQKLS